MGDEKNEFRKEFSEVLENGKISSNIPYPEDFKLVPVLINPASVLPFVTSLETSVGPLEFEEAVWEPLF